jgi:hypothetical protein
MFQAHPAVSCVNDSEYLALRPLFIILLMLTVALPLILFARLYWLMHRDHLYKDKDIKFVYGAM